MVVPVAGSFNGYAGWLVRQFGLHGFHAEADVGSNTLQKKIRTSQLAQWNYICVVGEKEEQEFSVAVRERGGEQLGTMTIQDFVAKLQKEATKHVSQPLNTFEKFGDREVETTAPNSTPAKTGGTTPASSASQAKPKSASKPATGDEAVLENQPYIKGFGPTQADLKLFQKFSKEGIPKTPNLKRWFEHIESFTATERANWSSA